jgi:hypothetical protein
VLHRESRPEFARALREGALATPPPPPPRSYAARFASRLSAPFGLVLAGSAGGWGRAAPRLPARAALLAGLHAAERDDFPVTVKTGHSLSELVLSPRPLAWSGVTQPDAIVVASEEGLGAARRALAQAAPRSHLYLVPGLALPPSLAERFPLDLAASGVALGRAGHALALLSAALLHMAVLPREALLAAAELEEGPRAREALQAIEAGAALARKLALA